MRESHWRAILAYWNLVVACWGGAVMLFTPVAIEGALGPDFTSVWTTCALVGGLVGSASVLIGGRRGRLYQPAKLVEMMANVLIMLAVLLYAISLWGFVAAGLTERTGLAIVIQLVALPSLLRVLDFLYKLARGVLVSLAPDTGDDQ
jgi:hypothetical protein